VNWRRGAVAAAAVEAALIAAHIAAYLAVVVAVLPPVKAVVFVLAQQALSACTWAARSPPTTRGCRSSPATRPTPCGRQVLTARNIRGGRVTDVVFGGLNYQIEHHLFPSMPSANLRRAQPLVREFCRTRGSATGSAACSVPTRRSAAPARRRRATAAGQDAPGPIGPVGPVGPEPRPRRRCAAPRPWQPRSA